MLILTDCDGVMLDWRTSFDEWVDKRIPNNAYIFVDGTYRLADRYHISDELAAKYVKEFNESENILHLKPFEDALFGIDWLNKHGHRLGVISSLSDDKQACEWRKENLNNIFGDVFDFITCIEGDKDEELIPYINSGLYWLEDKPENVKLGSEMGLKSVMFIRDYNANYHDNRIMRVENWVQFINKMSNNILLK